jgi:hypothetical protein
MIKQKMQHMIGWGHPSLIFHLKNGDVNLFVDCTFSVVPYGFTQLLIMMAYFPAYNMYVPVFYVLMQSREEQAYLYAINSCCVAANMSLKVKTFTCDFERGLLNALHRMFPSAHMVGCLFHLKQALRRKLIACKIPLDTVSSIVGVDGVIELLTVIPENEIMGKGIAYVRSKINETQHSKEYNTFWKYFLNTWLKKYKPQMWNIHTIQQKQLETEQDIIVN